MTPRLSLFFQNSVSKEQGDAEESLEQVLLEIGHPPWGAETFRYKVV